MKVSSVYYLFFICQIACPDLSGELAIIIIRLCVKSCSFCHVRFIWFCSCRIHFDTKANWQKKPL